MQYADKVLKCRDCGQSFTFTSGEQEFYASLGFDNPPSRCSSCRAAHEAGRAGAGNGYGSNGSSSGGYATVPRRELFAASCAHCGREARVPFQPCGDKPVYCSDCFETQRGRTSGRYRRGAPPRPACAAGHPNWYHWDGAYLGREAG